MSFFGDVFDGIGSAVDSIFGSGSSKDVGSAIQYVGSAAANAYSSMNTPAPAGAGSMSMFGPHQNSTDNPLAPGPSKMAASEDPRALEMQWLERMRRFRTLGLITTPPKYSYGEQ